MGVDHRIESVVTQGAVDADTGIEYYVTSYYVSYKWNEHDTYIVLPRLFMGNSNALTPVANSMPPAIVARHVRIKPWTWNDDRIALQWDVYGQIGTYNSMSQLLIKSLIRKNEFCN